MKSIAATENDKARCVPSNDSEMDFTISFYENELPSFVEVELERLYENVYTSLARYKIYAEVENASTYIVQKGIQIVTIFLFQMEKNEVKVLNKQIKIDEEEIIRFANAIFSRFGSINIISFYAIESNINRLTFPHQQYNCLEDIVLILPETPEKYLASLRSNTRCDVKKYIKNFEQKFPSFKFETYLKEDISEHHIREIISLTEARMAFKGKPSYICDAETKRIILLVKIYGLVGVITIDGRICAGHICYCVGTKYFMHVIGHDPQYNDYKLGIICNYFSICDSIVRGGRECRLMGGGHKYKAKFLAAPLMFDSLSVYRSRMQFLLNVRRVLKIQLRIYYGKLNRLLLASEQKENFVHRLVAKAITCARRLKQSKIIK